jgi:diadenosine tetraphosphate (Ap4A) HIT family hydrolase
MSAWNDAGRWAALCSGATCPVCRRTEPLDLLAGLEAAWVTAPEAAPMRGYVCLVARIHAVDLHELPAPAAAAFMHDAQLTSRVLSSTTGAIKLNYEIHGNSLPHLHMHFYPRYPGDRFEGRPIDPAAPPRPVYGPGEFAQFRRAFLARLDELR